MCFNIRLPASQLRKQKVFLYLVGYSRNSSCGIHSILQTDRKQHREQKDMDNTQTTNQVAEGLAWVTQIQYRLKWAVEDK